MVIIREARDCQCRRLPVLVIVGIVLAGGISSISAQSTSSAPPTGKTDSLPSSSQNISTSKTTFVPATNATTIEELNTTPATIVTEFGTTIIHDNETSTPETTLNPTTASDGAMTTVDTTTSLTTADNLPTKTPTTADNLPTNTPTTANNLPTNTPTTANNLPTETSDRPTTTSAAETPSKNGTNTLTTVKKDSVVTTPNGSDTTNKGSTAEATTYTKTSGTETTTQTSRVITTSAPHNTGTKAQSNSNNTPGVKAHPANTSGSSSTGIIVGVCFALLFAVVVVGAFLYIRRRRFANNYGRLEEDRDASWSAFSRNPIYRTDDYQQL